MPFSSSTLAENARRLADATAQGGDVYVLDVVIKGGTGGPNVEVVVDTDAGVSVDELAAFSRELGFAFDTAELVDGHYTLTVTSPGATKPLTQPRQYPRHVGRTLEVTLRAGAAVANGADAAETDSESVSTPVPATITGTLAAVDLDAGTLALAVPGTGKKAAPTPLTVSFDDVAEARVKLPW